MVWQRKKVSELEKYLSEQEKLLFVERVRQRGVVKEVKPDMLLQPEDEIVLSGRREFVIGEEDWIGPEVIDAQLLDFPAETLPVMVTHRTFAGERYRQSGHRNLCTGLVSVVSNVRVSMSRYLPGQWWTPVIFWNLPE